MSFANPSAIWAIFIVFAFVACGVFYPRLLQKKLSGWIDRKFWPIIIPDFSAKIFYQKMIWLSLSLLLLVVALARPQWGEKDEIIQSEGMDILFLLDLSNSMYAEDTPPSRLNRAQNFIKKTLTNLADDRVGIIAFAGKAFMTVPLTTDFGYVSEVTDTLDPAAMVAQGTDIAAAIDTAIKAFERSAEDDHKISRAVILISDGEDFGPDANAAAKRLKDFGAGFYTLSVGTPEGAPIPVRNESGILQTYKKDLSGKTVLSRVNRELLSKLAASGGGQYLELVNADDAAYTVSKALRGFGRDAKKEQRQVVKIDRFPYFVLASLVFLFLHLFTGYTKLFLVFILLIPVGAQAQTLDSYLQSKKAEKLYQKNDFEGSAKAFEESRKNDSESSILQYNEATALAKNKSTEDSIFNFEEATKKALTQGDYDTATKSLYNEGITQSEQKNLKEAYDKLTKAIELSKISNQPDIEAKARAALQSLIEKQKQQSKDDQNKDKKDQDKKDQDKKDQEKKSQDKKDQDEQKKPDQQKDPKKTEDGKKREFKSGTLSKDVAESIMNDLSDREKQLYQHRMKEHKSREVPNDKDW